MKLYFAPMNVFGNKAFRELVLENGCDYAFSEMIRADRLELERKKGKLERTPKTVYQIACSTTEEISMMVEELKFAHEINLNMGCPQSSMKNLGGNLLHDKQLMKKLANRLAEECKKRGIIPSVKIRLGTSPDNIELDDYIELLKESGINKVYVHARTLRHPYNKACLKFKKPEGIEVIYNGDIDSYNSYLEVEHFDGVMIGRAALINPLIFRQIKNKQLSREGPYDPVYKDLSLEITDKTRLTAKKIDVIISFLNKNPSAVKMNLSYMLKGTNLQKKINESSSIDEMKALFFKELV